MKDANKAAAWFATAFVALVLLILGLLSIRWRDATTPTKDVVSLGGVDSTPSPWLNTREEAAYIGSATCSRCHADEHDSYLATHHARSMQPVDVDTEPANATFEHKKSGRTYEVTRKDGRLWHRESLLDEDGATIAHLEHPLEWLVGSGSHSRTYLIRSHGFLSESPVTWYERDKTWHVSPGFDNTTHWSFERGVDDGCLYCHVGRTESPEPFKLKLIEAAIGCERCHGPGSLHAAKHESTTDAIDAGKAAIDEDIDRTIVNPAHLSRDLQEDICAQCHLRGDATVALRGKRLSDFRPGEPLHRVRLDYRLLASDGGMTVVGHVEQMRQSRCRQESSMTCITCHDPHGGKKSITEYKQTCLQCHQAEHCGGDAPARKQKQDDCIACHMPSTPTDIPHIAFTHHRIGIHRENAARTNKQVDKLVELKPYREPRNLSERERLRARGLAYFEYAQKVSDPELAKSYRMIAKDALETLLEQGVPDSEIDAVLARFAYQSDPETAKHAALHALTDPQIRPATRAEMLALLGEVFLQQQEANQAVDTLLDLTRRRRRSDDYLLLGIARMEQRRFKDAVARLQEAVAINPLRPDLRRALAAAFAELGDQEAAQRERETASALESASPSR